MKRIVMAAVLFGMLSFAAAPSEASAAYRRSGGPGLLARTLGVRLYYSNAFRSYIPGTGYGGFARPAFGYRGY
jgi:hypothetical protein